MRSATIQRRLYEEALPAGTPDFDRLARIYRWMEWLTFGPFLSRCRCTFLDRLKHHRTALVLGDGDGRFTARLLAQYPRITVDAVDASGAMLNEMHRRVTSNSSRLQAHLSDARSFLPKERCYDVVVTHFFLDCFTNVEVESLAKRLRSHATDEAVWVVSEFAVPAAWHGQAIAEPIIHFLYVVFGWLTGLKIRHLPDHHLALTRAGWSLDEEQKRLGGLLVSQLWRRNPQLSTERPSL